MPYPPNSYHLVTIEPTGNLLQGIVFLLTFATENRDFLRLSHLRKSRKQYLIYEHLKIQRQ